MKARDEPRRIRDKVVGDNCRLHVERITMLEALIHEAWEVLDSAVETNDVYASGGRERVKDLLSRLKETGGT